MSDKIIQDLYRPILENCDLIFDEQGFISIKVDTVTLPFVIEDKRWVLPLKKRLESDSENVTIFNPLKESIDQDGSAKVLSRLRIAYISKLNREFNTLIRALLTITSSEAIHPTLVDEQRDILIACANCTSKTIEAYNKLMEAMQGNYTDKCIVSVFLKRGALIGETTFHRGAIVSWPLYTALKADDEKVFGIKITKKERENLITLMKYIVPGIDNPMQYSHGSLHKHCPFLDALLTSVALIQDVIDTQVQRYPTFLEDSCFKFNRDYEKSIASVEQHLAYIRLLPAEELQTSTKVNRDRERSRDDDRVELDRDDKPKSLASRLNAMSRPERRDRRDDRDRDRDYDRRDSRRDDDDDRYYSRRDRDRDYRDRDDDGRSNWRSRDYDHDDRDGGRRSGRRESVDWSGTKEIRRDRDDDGYRRGRR